MDVEVAEVLLEPIESERGIWGREEDVGSLASALPPLPTLLAVVELALLPDPVGEGPGTTTDGLCIGDTARPMPSETALCPSLPGASPPPGRVGGAAPRPKEPLTSRGFSPSLSKRERRLDRSACGICFDWSRLLAFAAAPLSKAAILDLNALPPAPVGLDGDGAGEPEGEFDMMMGSVRVLEVGSECWCRPENLSGELVQVF